jgi:DNA ligase (NAD+)
MTKLEQQISYYQQKYYEGNPVISDAAFDTLWDQLPADSPLLHVVGNDSINFQKAPHIMIMGSQGKAKNEEEFQKWFDKQNEKNFLIQPKLDGASIELQYYDGNFSKAVTRGDGSWGDDVTANIRKANGVPITVSNFTGAVRGEVLILKDDLEQFFPEFKNARNGAVGVMKQKYGEGCEHLTVICYDVFGLDATKESEKWQWIQTNGFNPVSSSMMDNAKEIIDFRNYTAKHRDELQYDIDGIVVKCDTVDQEDLNKDRPDHQIAFKFDQSGVITTLLDVTWNQSGATFTPVANVSPCDLNGTTVQNASLANLARFLELVADGLSIGAEVLATKRGEIIPYIESVVTPGTKKLIIKKTCDTCGSTLIKDGPFLVCNNSDCYEKIVHRIRKWVNEQNIMFLSTSTIDKLMENGLLDNIRDLYSLSVEDVLDIPGLGQGFSRVITEIEKARHITLAKLLGGFDMDGIGTTIWESIISELGVNSLTELLSLISKDSSILLSVPGIAQERAMKILEELSDHGEELLELEAILDIQKPVKASTGGKLAGLSFCFTGALNSMKRNEAEALVAANGGTVSSVKKGLTYLVTNDSTSGSSKNVKAQSLGITLINEQEFLGLL